MDALSVANFSICVYCGSREGLNPAHRSAARAVGQWIGEHGGQLVYGGGRNGLMGQLADATMAAGGTAVGIIPKSMVEREWAHQDCQELHVVDTMHERKRMMAERADAFLAMPGGIGTFEEFFEAWTWRQLGYHDKPTALLNTEGYYDGLIAFLQSSAAAGFMNQSQLDLIQIGSDATTLLPQLIQQAGLPGPARLDLT